MDQLARILFHMDAVDAYLFVIALSIFHHQPAVAADRQGKLGYLIAFGQIRIKVVFAVKFAETADLAVKGQAGFDGQLYGVAVQHR